MYSPCGAESYRVQLPKAVGTCECDELLPIPAFVLRVSQAEEWQDRVITKEARSITVNVVASHDDNLQQWGAKMEYVSRVHSSARPRCLFARKPFLLPPPTFMAPKHI
jgi:hypothetical protein